MRLGGVRKRTSADENGREETHGKPITTENIKSSF